MKVLSERRLAVDSSAADPVEGRTESLSFGRKLVYASGDFSLTAALSCLSLLYAAHFLTQTVGLSPFLAGLVPLIGRIFDAVTDPLFGRWSDGLGWRQGRRRPFFLIGAVPFGLSFALLWLDVPFSSEGAQFVYYTVVYCLFSLSLTTLGVPYFAIQPEMIRDYDERTSLNICRSIAAIIGFFAAIAFRPLATWLEGTWIGEEAGSYFAAGLLTGIVLILPWFAVHRATHESTTTLPALTSDRKPLRTIFTILGQRSFRQLIGLFLLGRVAVDLVGTLLLLYVSFWIGRSDSFEILMVIFLLSVALSLPAWHHLSRRTEKSLLFIAGASWWILASGLLFAMQPGWPIWILYAMAPLLAVGYAIVDMMPISMLADVVDEDQLRTGERREGLYFGVFMLLRKLAGGLTVFLALAALDLAGFVQGPQQSEAVREAIRALVSIGPGVFLLLAIIVARQYPISRARHLQIRRSLRQKHHCTPH